VTATASPPPAVAGEPCSSRAEVREGLSCVRGRSGLQWQARYAYQEQACDPEDKRIKQAGVILPRKGLPEARVAAACVTLEWLANKNVDYPELQVLSEWKLPKVALADAAARARGALRLFWKYRGIEAIKPTYMVFTSPAEFCALATKYFDPGLLSAWKVRGFSTGPDDMPWIPDCNDTKPFSGAYFCESGPYAAVWPGGAIDRKSGGAFGYQCRKDLESWSGLNTHKFWQGVQGPIALSIGEDTQFSYALLYADYLFSDYAGILTEADLSGSSADLCSPASRYYTCKHDLMKGKLTTYESSSTWWTAGALENGFSAEYMWARQTAMDWFVAHFGLDAAYLLPLALVGVTTEAEYHAVLDSYTDWSHEQVFAGIDAWVAPQFGLTAP